MRLWAMLTVCVSNEGNPSDAKVIKSIDPTATTSSHEHPKLRRCSDGRIATTESMVGMRFRLRRDLH
jgi:hypothetical protein